MQQNYLIGIGGTGARVMEAAIHSAAAGLGPDRLTVFLIDPDMSNGNLARTTSLLANYRSVRNAIKDRAADPESRFFHTEITAPKPLVWGLGEHNHTLGKYLNHAGIKDTPLGRFMSVLFSADELRTELNEGFRGHPSIGAVLLASTNMEEEPWKSFWDSIHDCAEHEARVFMVGSIFGGTGAAGVPTFGAPDVLKFREAATIEQRNPQAGVRGRSRVFLGTALVLPYFSVVADGSVAKGDMYVTSDDFPIATKAALQFYADKPELAFDEMYVIGDSLAQNAGAFSKGSKKQENRAHYVESATALAAFDFFRQPPPVDISPRVFATARESRMVDWQAMPVTRHQDEAPARQAELKLQLTTLAVFAYALRTYGADFMNAGERHPEFSARPWVKRNFDKEKGDPRNDAESKDVISKASSFAQRFLEWISEVDGESVRLFDRTKLWQDDAMKELVPPYLRGAPSLAIGTLLKGEKGRGLTFSAFVDALDARNYQSQNMRPADRFLQLFYSAALDFSRKNYFGAAPKGN